MTEVRSRQRPPSAAQEASQVAKPKKGKSLFSDDRVAQEDLPPKERRGGRVAEFPMEVVRDLSEAMYRVQLGDGDTRSMIQKDGDDGKKLRERAQINDPFARTFLTVLREWGIEVPLEANPKRRPAP